jgi:uncharacterized protein (TIGR02246 family)
MKRRFPQLPLVALSLLAGNAFAQAPADEAKIRALAAEWEIAWNNHDVKALGALFTENADFVNVGAKHWRGRREIEAKHAATLPRFAESKWSNSDVGVQFISPDVSIVHVTWGMKGDKNPDGSSRAPREGAFMWVVVKDAGQWRIRAAQNTNRSNLPEQVVGK